MNESVLMVFVKNLVPGVVKTRLAERIGMDKALDVYVELVKRTHHIVDKLEVDKRIYYNEYIEIGDVWNPDNYTFRLQRGHSLGEKMSAAFNETLSSYKKVVIIGSDCYDLTTDIIKEAFNRLKDNDVVTGPAKDGGYYLLGMNDYFPQLFRDKTYSTENVLRELLEEAEASDLTVYQLPTLSDIDTIEDLEASSIAWKYFDEKITIGRETGSV